MKKFCLNLSFISQPCVRTAAIVVSEIIDRLSPNMAPHTTAPMQMAKGNPVCCETPRAMGASAVIVPIDVPMEREIKHPITNSPGTINWGGITDRPKLTVLSTPPAAVTTPEKAPATMKIRIIVMIFTSPAPFAMMDSFSSKVSFLFCSIPTNKAATKATSAGIP